MENRKNPEYCLLGICLNEPEYLQEIKSNIFLTPACRDLYTIITREPKFNKQTILDIIKKTGEISEDDFYDAYQAEYRADQFKTYHEYVATKYARQKLLQGATEIYRNNIKTIDE